MDLNLTEQAGPLGERFITICRRLRAVDRIEDERPKLDEENVVNLQLIQLNSAVDLVHSPFHLAIEN